MGQRKGIGGMKFRAPRATSASYVAKTMFNDTKDRAAAQTGTKTIRARRKTERQNKKRGRK
jgi:hypothetical protein